MNSIWNAIIPLYLVGGILFVALNMKSRLWGASARALDRHGLSWTAIPMILLSAALWPLWWASGYLIKWLILRKLDREEPK